MTDSRQKGKNQALHELMETEFQQLVDIIEQKQILHEDLEFGQEKTADSITQSTRQLHRQSQELGADTLAEYFNELENSARNGEIRQASELLENIHSEFEKVKDILSGN
jgi:AraC-like DNA-binding protein